MEYAENGETHIFHIYFFYMGFSLTLTGMKTAKHVVETHWEGRVSRKLDIVLIVFVFH